MIQSALNVCKYVLVPKSSGDMTYILARSSSTLLWSISTSFSGDTRFHKGLRSSSVEVARHGQVRVGGPGPDHLLLL